ncbi:MAG: CRISPR-associated protein Cas4, partial [Vulcanisaeta sp.]
RGAINLDNVITKLCGDAVNVLREYPVYSRSLGIHGNVDYLCLYPNHAVPIEVKPLSKISRKSLFGRHRHYLMQAVAYSVAVEETLRTTVKHFIVLARDNYITIRLTPALKSLLRGVVQELRTILISERLPNRISDGLKCGYCRFSSICRPA